MCAGTSVSGEVAMKFTRDTGALVCLHDLSSMSLQQPHFDFGRIVYCKSDDVKLSQCVWQCQNQC